MYIKLTVLPVFSQGDDRIMFYTKQIGLHVRTRENILFTILEAKLFHSKGRKALIFTKTFFSRMLLVLKKLENGFSRV